MATDRPRKILQAAARDASARARLLAEALDALADAADGASERAAETSTERMAAGREAPSDRLWNVGDVAKFIGASESWVRQAVAGGRLPVKRIGGLLRFHPDEIRQYTRGEHAPPARVLRRGER